MEVKTKEEKKAEYAQAMQNLANLLKNKYHIKTIEASTLYLEELWVWKNNFYNRNGESTIHSEIFFEDGLYNKADYSFILDKIKGQTRTTREEINSTKFECTNIINGTIHYDNKNIRFVPRNEDDHKYNFNYIIPVEYDKDATCPEIDKILKDVLETEDKINIFYEYLGSLFLNNYRFKKAVVMVGVPGTAKTTTINMAYQFVGQSNYCSVSIDKMDSEKNRFTAVKLDGKLANICDEMPKISPTNIDTFKVSTGGGTFYVEDKGRAGYFMTNNAKMLFAANELPSIDESIAESFFSRIVLLEFTKVFLEPDPSFKNKIYSNKELSGLLNHALEGLQRLLDNDGYTQDEEDVPTIWNKYLLGGTILREFVLKNLAITNRREDEIPKSAMYVRYVKYKISKKETPISKKAFGIYMSTMKGICSGQSSKKDITGQQDRIWYGCMFLPEAQKNEDGILQI